MCTPKNVVMSLKFELSRNICTMHLPIKFHHPTFDCSEVIVFTNKQTNNNQRDFIKNIHIVPLCYASGEKAAHVTAELHVSFNVPVTNINRLSPIIQINCTKIAVEKNDMRKAYTSYLSEVRKHSNPNTLKYLQLLLQKSQFSLTNYFILL